MKRVLVFAWLVIVALSCSDNRNSKEALQNATRGKSLVEEVSLSYEDELETEPPRSSQPGEPSPKTSQENEKQSKIIKDGAITLEVDSLEMAKRTIDSILDVTNAYFEHEVYHDGGNQHRYTLKIRIPSNNFDGFIASIENGDGKMISKSINARDVTSEYIDLEIRLKNNQAYLAQYRALLKRAKSIKDILEIEEKARRIESEIDSQLGRMKYINDQVNYSTLNLNMYQKYIHKNEYKAPSFMSRVWDSTKHGFSLMQEIILWLIALWPLVILVGLGFTLKKLYSIRKKKEN